MIETLYHFPWTDIILTTIVSLLLLSLFVYMIMTIVDEDENYETYLLQVDGEPYLVVKKKALIEVRVQKLTQFIWVFGHDDIERFDSSIGYAEKIAKLFALPKEVKTSFFLILLFSRVFAYAKSQ